MTNKKSLYTTIARSYFRFLDQALPYLLEQNTQVCVYLNTQEQTHVFVDIYFRKVRGSLDSHIERQRMKKREGIRRDTHTHA